MPESWHSCARDASPSLFRWPPFASISCCSRSAAAAATGGGAPPPVPAAAAAAAAPPVAPMTAALAAAAMAPTVSPCPAPTEAPSTACASRGVVKLEAKGDGMRLGPLLLRPLLVPREPRMCQLLLQPAGGAGPGEGSDELKPELRPEAPLWPPAERSPVLMLPYHAVMRGRTCL